MRSAVSRGRDDALQLGIDEAEIEGGVVRNQRRIFDKTQELVGHVLEQRLVLQEIDGEAVHGDGVRMDIALGIEIAVELAAGWDAVDDLDAAELDQAIAAGRVEARGLGVEHDLAQHRVDLMRIREHYRGAWLPACGGDERQRPELGVGRTGATLQRFDDFIDLRVGLGKRAAGVHNEIGALRFSASGIWRASN